MDGSPLKYCRNCGTLLHGEYCSSCGQRDRDLNVPVKELASEFAGIIPSFDKRFLRSIKPFLLSPGFLTSEYLSGRRKKYLSPYKFYFVISFLFFFVSTLNTSEAKKEMREGLIHGDSTTSAAKDDSTKIIIRDRNSGVTFAITDSSKLEKLFGRRFMEGFRSGKNNPEMFFGKIKEHLPKIIFLLLPVFALLLKLVYVRSKILYIKHLVFSFYFHSFIFAILLIDTLAEMALPRSLHLYGNAILLSIPMYLYLGLKDVYRQSHWKTTVKFLLLSFSHFIVFIFSISLFVVITVLLFFT